MKNTSKKYPIIHSVIQIYDVFNDGNKDSSFW